MLDCFLRETHIQRSLLGQHLHSFLVHEFHQQKHELYHSSSGHLAAVGVKYHWYKKADGYFSLSFLLIELYNQPTKKFLLEYGSKNKKVFKIKNTFEQRILYYFSHVPVYSEREDSLFPREALLFLQTLFLQLPLQIFFEAVCKLCYRMLHDQFLFLTPIYIVEVEWSCHTQSPLISL